MTSRQYLNKTISLKITATVFQKIIFSKLNEVQVKKLSFEVSPSKGTPSKSLLRLCLHAHKGILCSLFL